MYFAEAGREVSLNLVYFENKALFYFHKNEIPSHNKVSFFQTDRR
jgi:hypothetical protein